MSKVKNNKTTIIGAHLAKHLTTKVHSKAKEKRWALSCALNDSIDGADGAVCATDWGLQLSPGKDHK